MSLISKELSTEQFLKVSPTLAKKIGLNEAIFIEQLHNLIQIKISNKKNLIDGETWVFNTIPEWQNDHFIFWSESTVKRIINSLIKNDLIKTHNYNLDKRNHKLGYTINYPKTKILE